MPLSDCLPPDDKQPPSNRCAEGKYLGLDGLCKDPPTCADGVWNWETGECISPPPSPCPSGTFWNGSICVPFSTRCPPGSHYDSIEDKCVPDGDCPEGLLRGPFGNCQPPVPPFIKPPPPTKWCGPGLVWNGSSCVSSPCPSGYTRLGDECVPTPCPLGQRRNNEGLCVPDCPEGWTLNEDGFCQADLFWDPPPITPVPDQKYSPVPQPSCSTYEVRWSLLRAWRSDWTFIWYWWTGSGDPRNSRWDLGTKERLAPPLTSADAPSPYNTWEVKWGEVQGTPPFRLVQIGGPDPVWDFAGNQYDTGHAFYWRIYDSLNQDRGQLNYYWENPANTNERIAWNGFATYCRAGNVPKLRDWRCISGPGLGCWRITIYFFEVQWTKIPSSSLLIPTPGVHLETHVLIYARPTDPKPELYSPVFGDGLPGNTVFIRFAPIGMPIEYYPALPQVLWPMRVMTGVFMEWFPDSLDAPIGVTLQ